MTCPLIKKKIKNCTGCPYFVEGNKQFPDKCRIEELENEPWKIASLIIKNTDFNEGVW